MSDRLRDALSFHGRLSRRGERRLQMKLMLVAAVGWLLPFVFLAYDAPRPLVFAPLVLVLLCLVATLAAWVRRLHDVGRHARHEMVRMIFSIVMLVVPLVGAFILHDRGQVLYYGLLAISGVTLLVLAVQSLHGSPAWAPGDPGPNEFGPPPER